eukprot:scaffold248509_cov17-Tisochrysis_lutea.AAC.1
MSGFTSSAVRRSSCFILLVPCHQRYAPQDESQLNGTSRMFKCWSADAPLGLSSYSVGLTVLRVCCMLAASYISLQTVPVCIKGNPH